MLMNRVFLTGYMGSGKSAMGKLLASNLGLSFIDLDNYIEGKFHKTIAQIFKSDGEDSFREKEKICLREVGEFENVVVATGGGAPCFFDNMEYINKQGISIYLKLSPEQLVERLQKGRNGVRPLISGKSPEELKQFITQTLSYRSQFYEMARVVISGTDAEIVDKITAFTI